jgi:Mrp family chromosome partitioning ATPase
MTQTLVISALKGGTGKSTTTANLGRALRRRGYRVGLLDVDATAPTLHKALGLDIPPWEKKTAHETIIPTVVEDGLYLVTLAGLFSEKPAVLWKEPELVETMHALVTDLIEWPEIDYLLIDSPPNSSGYMQMLFEFLGKSLTGVVLVFQPTDIAAADLLRSFDFMVAKELTLIGLIANQAYCVAPNGEWFWPYLSPQVDLQSFCAEVKVNYLGAIPLTPNQEYINERFDGIAEKIRTVKPTVFRPGKIDMAFRKIKRKGLTGMIKKVGIEYAKRQSNSS